MWAERWEPRALAHWDRACRRRKPLGACALKRPRADRTGPPLLAGQSGHDLPDRLAVGSDTLGWVEAIGRDSPRPSTARRRAPSRRPGSRPTARLRYGLVRMSVSMST